MAGEFIGRQRRMRGIGQMKRELEPRALGEIVERLETLDRDARDVIAGAAVEFDRHQPALTVTRGGLKRGRGLVVEHHRLILPAGVGDRRHHVAATLGRGPPARRFDQPGHHRRPARAVERHRQRREPGKAANLVRGEQMTLGIDRVRGEIKAECLALGGHPLGHAPAGIAGQTDPRDLGLRRAPEQTALPAGALVVSGGGVRENGLGGGKEGSAVGVDAIERARGGEAFELAAVEQFGIDPRGEVVERLERAVRAALVNQRRHRFLADALERAERIADLAILDREIGLAGVDVGAKAVEPAATDILDEQCQFVGLRHVEAHRRGEEFGRVVRLQPGGVIGDQSVSRGMALVEAIAGELVDQVEQLIGLGRGDGVDGGALDEARALRIHLGLDLLAHRAAKEIGLPKAVAGEHLRRLHHLFLVDEDAVGLGQHLLKHRVRVSERHPAVLAVAEQRDIVHRAGAVERNQRDNVAECGRANRRQRAAHAFGFELEYPDGVAALKQVVDCGIVPGEAIVCDRNVTPGEQALGFLEHRQRLESEEIELHQPRGLDVLHVELGHRHVRTRVAVERDEFVERAVADDDPGSMGRAVPRQPLELHREVEQSPHALVILIFGGKLADPVERARQVPRLGRMVGDELGKAIDLAIAHLEHAPGILEHRARLQPPESDDLRNPVAAIFGLDVGDHLVAVGFAEIDVEVGHRDAFGIEEALEQQVQFDRVEVGDLERPGDDAPRARPAPRADRNVVRLGPLNEVGDDQEVSREPHPGDDIDLELEAVAVGLLPIFRSC